MQLPSAMMTESSAQLPILIFAARWSESNPTANKANQNSARRSEFGNRRY